VNISPTEAAAAVSGTFIDFVADWSAKGASAPPIEMVSYLMHDAREPGDLPPPSTLSGGTEASAFRGDDWILGAGMLLSGENLAALHTGEVDSTLADILVEAEIAGRQEARGSTWLIVQRDLAWAYKCLLTEELARRNRLTATTDQVAAHSALSGMSATQLVLEGMWEPMQWEPMRHPPARRCKLGPTYRRHLR
jgi:hypothetical protein